MLLYFAVGVVALLAALMAYAATRPDEFRMQRSTRVAAPPTSIIPLLDDFHAWKSWSPYEKLDPAMVRTYEGAGRGAGAVYRWEGNKKAGAGRMEITGADPSNVTIDLSFTRPFRARNVSAFTLEPQGDATQVTWSMSGLSPFPSKLFGVFVDMDKLVGKDFEVGLANLKSLAERSSPGARAGG
jgi:hypothetical protein